MLVVRELRPEDNLTAVLTLCKEFFDEYEQHHEEFFDTDNLRDADISGRFLESMESDNSATIIALLNDVIVGYASVSVREQPQFYKVKNVGAISGLMVAKDHRRKGIAGLLFQEVKAFFRRHGIKYFIMYTAVANQAAIKFYEQNGMIPLHTTFIGEANAEA